MNEATVLEDVSEAISDIYGQHYAVADTVVKSYLVDNLLVCVLEEPRSLDGRPAAEGHLVLEQRQNFQRRQEAAFCAAVERLTRRRVKTFLSANHVADGIAAEVFFLDPAESVS